MNQDEQNFATLLSGLTDRQIRESCIEAVRRVRSNGDKASTIRLDPMTIQYELVPILREHHQRQDEVHVQVASLVTHLNTDWATPLLEFFVWLERSGLAVCYGGVQEPVQRVRLLPAGLKFFDSRDDAHPLVPGWAERLRQRCPKLTDDTLDLLVDSHQCFERGLLRASIALLGVAFESVVEDAYNAMIATGLQRATPGTTNASQRLASVRAGAALKFSGNQSARMSAEHACDFADRLRYRRNDASHRKTAFAFGDRQEVEEFLIVAALHLPPMHSLL